jgi:hypothetical protein
MPFITIMCTGEDGPVEFNLWLSQELQSSEEVAVL